jgi:two-component system, chemotaxis family, CheB/CheR fusion protein
MPAKKTAKPRERQGSKSPGAQNKSAEDTQKTLPIVGIGASAGGLKAFEQFFENMPPDNGIGFVLIPHLDPGHVSMLPDLLRKHCQMPVLQAQDSMTVRGDCVHVIPPNREMVIMHGKLLLKAPSEPRGLRLPINTFFRSLAEDQKDMAICVILSGNGTDGTLGLKAIKAETGMAMVQDPSSAEYDGMPRSAIETGMVDYILTPDKMGAHLVAFFKHQISRRVAGYVSGVDRLPESLQKIFHLLRTTTGHDFTYYKKNTICRRIERRMGVHEIERVADYVSYLEHNPQEVAILFKEILIGVTNFFRDPKAFQALSERLLADVLAEKPRDYSVRVWVPGCSSGEEVYSIAIILRECMDKLKKNFKVQIFGTDIDTDGIDTARAGLYPASIVSDVTPERLKRFFVAEGDSLRIKKEIREMAVFAVQDILKDPPFTKLDLLSCRNLLIYLDAELQKKLLPLFHYVLKPDGILFLGTSESVDGFTDLFSLVDKKWKLFRRRASSAAAESIVQFPTAPLQLQGALSSAANQSKPKRESAIFEVAQKFLVETYAPPGVFVDANGQVVYAHGSTGKYLELAPGHASLNVIEMAREGIRHELAAAIRKAKLQKRQVSLGGLQVKTNGGSQELTLTVKPVRGSDGVGELLMIVFEDTAPKQVRLGKVKGTLSPKAVRRVSQLEQELRYSQEHLQTTIEELETSNEELKSSNEEMQSTNEELQSTNEELESSKEELQSLNEELVTVNAELQGKIEELSRANDDMRNLLDSTRIATIFLDRDLRIQRFTSETTRIINLIPSDVGRPINHIVSNLEDDALFENAQQVIDSLVARERTVRTKEGRLYLSRIMPYRTLDNVIDGVVITFTDITEETMSRNARNLAEGIVESVRDPLVVLDEKFLVIAANSSFYAFFRATPDDTIGKSFFELGNAQWNIPKLRDLLEQILPQNKQINEFIVEHNFPVIGHKKMSIDALRVRREGMATETLLLTIKDITEPREVRK